ncbi:hypothetical protein MKW92_038261 [Papaver armeniacum]|nr:hypothetical protein MKW92_038261 [Papaver armeniacum]
MDKIEIMTSYIQGLSTVQKLQQLQQSDLNEKERVVVEGILENAVTQLKMVQSQMKKTLTESTSAPSLNFGAKQQGGKMEDIVCRKCGKFKKLKTVGAVVITELDVIRRLKAGCNAGGNQVLSQDRDEILSRAVWRKFQTHHRATSPPLLVPKVGFGGSEEMISCPRREQKYRPTDGVMQPTLMKFGPSGVEVNPDQDRTANSRSHRNRESTGYSSTSEASSSAEDYNESYSSGEESDSPPQCTMHLDSRRTDRSTGSSPTFAASSSFTDCSASNSSSEDLDSPPRRATQLDHHRTYRSISRSRSPQSLYSGSNISYTSNDSYDSSPEEEYPVAYSNRSYTSYDSSLEEEYPVAYSNKSYTSYDSYDSSLEEEYPVAHSNRSYTSYDSYDSSPEEEYPAARRSRFLKYDPPQKKMGHVRRLTTKLGGMFRRDHHGDSSKDDKSARDHHPSVQKPVGNGKLHHEIKGKHMPIQTRRTAKVEDKASHQQGFLTLAKRVRGHVFGSKTSKPSSSGVRRLERAVTGKEKVTAKKRHWWHKLQRQGLPNKRGKTPLKLGFENKHTQLKGQHRHRK